MSRKSIAERHATISVILKYDLLRHERLRMVVESDLVARAKEKGALPLKRTLWDILFIILEDYLTGSTTLISNLHVETGLAKPTVNSRLNELMSMGVVSARTDEADRRRRILSLTGAFKKVVDRFVDECSSEFKDLIDIHDRRERIEAEKSLRESEARYRDLVEGSIQGIVIVQDRRPVFANQAAADILGYGGPKDILNLKSADVLVAPQDRGRLSENFAKRLRGEAVTSIYEIQGRSRDGSLVWIENRERLVVWEDKPALQATFVEISARKEAEEALRSSESNYRLLVENLRDLVVKIDLEGHFQFVSPSYCRTFGKTEAELIGKAFMPLVHEDDRETTEQAMQQLFEPPYSAYLEQRALTKDGWRWIAWMDSAIHDAEGNISAIIGVGRDVTLQRRMESALRENRARFRAIMDNAPAAILLKDTEGRLVAANKGFLELSGLKWENVEGKTASTYSPKKVAEEIAEQERQVMDRRQPQSFHVEREFKGCGKRRFVVVRFPIIAEDGQVIGVGGLSFEVNNPAMTDLEALTT